MGITKSSKKRTPQQEKNIENVMKKTGWSYDYAVLKIKQAKKNVGITYKDYDVYNFFKVEEEKQEEEYNKILERKALNKERRENCLMAIMEEKCCDREEAVEILKDVRSKYDIKYREFLKFGFQKLNDDQYDEMYEEVLYARNRAKARKERKAKKNEKLIATVVANTGWTYEEAKAKMDRAAEQSGAEYKDYVAYRFWEISEEEQNTYFTKGDANYLRKKYNTNKDNVAYFMDKDQFNKVFSDCLGRTWSYNKGSNFDEFKNKFNNSKIIYKPLSASCGSGINVFDVDDSNAESVYERLSALPMGVVEGYLIQHPEVAKYSVNAVNTIRIVSVLDNDEVHILYAAFRMAGGDAVVDNFHNGGVLAIIDIETGEVITDALDLSGKMFSHHPTTGVKVKGFVIPYWKEIVELIKKAGKIVDGIGYVGWDVAITEDGPVLIEGNTAPAPNVLQMPFLKERKGMKHAVERFLDKK